MKNTLWMIALALGSASTLYADALPTQAYDQGENFVYAIRWGGITGGYSNLSIKEIESIGGRPAYHIVSEAQSTGLVNALYPVQDRNEAWLDTQIPRSLRYEKNAHEGKYRAHQIVELNQETHRFHEKEIRADRNTTEEKDGDIPPNVLDILSSLYYIRSMPLVVGQSYTMDVHSGEKTWPLIVNVKKRESIKVSAGKFDCFLVEPVLRGQGLFVAKGKKLEVWMTADAAHVPVLMRSEVVIGHVSAELVSRHDAPARGNDPTVASASQESETTTLQ